MITITLEMTNEGARSAALEIKDFLAYATKRMNGTIELGEPASKREEHFPNPAGAYVSVRRIGSVIEQELKALNARLKEKDAAERVKRTLDLPAGMTVKDRRGKAAAR